MTTPSLHRGFLDYRKHLAHELGWTFDVDNWSQDQIDQLLIFVNEGISQVYYPPILANERKPHIWSFMRLNRTLTTWQSLTTSSGITVTGVHADGSTTITASGAAFYDSMVGKTITITDIGAFTITGYESTTEITVSGDATCAAKTFSITADGDYTLSDDVGSLESSGFAFAASQGGGRVVETGWPHIQELRSLNNTTGKPRLFAQRARSADGTQAQLREVMYWPTPDSAYVLYFPYAAMANEINEDNPYPLGGPRMSPVYLASCLAVAEFRRDDRHGSRWNNFMIALGSAVGMDRSTLTRPTVGIEGGVANDGTTPNSPFGATQFGDFQITYVNP